MSNTMIFNSVAKKDRIPHEFVIPCGSRCIGRTIEQVETEIGIKIRYGYTPATPIPSETPIKANDVLNVCCSNVEFNRIRKVIECE